MSRLRLCSVVLMRKVRLLLLRVRLAVSDVRSVRRLARMGRLRLIISVRILIIVSVRIVGLVKRFVRDILFSDVRKNCCAVAWRFFFRLRDARDIISVWTQFRKLGTLSFGKSAKSIRKILKLACGSDSEYFAHNADFPELRVTTLPAKFAQTEIMPRAVYWLFRITVHTPLSREVFWHEYAKIPRHTSQNSIAAGNLE